MQKERNISPQKYRKPQPIDFAALKEKGYEILNENIAVNPKSISEDSWLEDQLEFYIELDKREQELFKEYEGYYTPLVMEYFLFDLNGDGVEEYIIAFSGSGLGRYGSAVSILRKTEDGGSERIVWIATEFFASDNKNYPLAVLDDMVDGYYSFVLLWTNVIWKYDKEFGTYNAYKYQE